MKHKRQHNSRGGGVMASDRSPSEPCDDYVSSSNTPYVDSTTINDDIPISDHVTPNTANSSVPSQDKDVDPLRHSSYNFMAESINDEKLENCFDMNMKSDNRLSDGHCTSNDSLGSPGNAIKSEDNTITDLISNETSAIDQVTTSQVEATEKIDNGVAPNKRRKLSEDDSSDDVNGIKDTLLQMKSMTSLSTDLDIPSKVNFQTQLLTQNSSSGTSQPCPPQSQHTPTYGNPQRNTWGHQEYIQLDKIHMHQQTISGKNINNCSKFEQSTMSTDMEMQNNSKSMNYHTQLEQSNAYNQQDSYYGQQQECMKNSYGNNTIQQYQQHYHHQQQLQQQPYSNMYGNAQTDKYNQHQYVGHPTGTESYNHDQQQLYQGSPAEYTHQNRHNYYNHSQNNMAAYQQQYSGYAHLPQSYLKPGHGQGQYRQDSTNIRTASRGGYHGTQNNGNQSCGVVAMATACVSNNTIPSNRGADGYTGDYQQCSQMMSQTNPIELQQHQPGMTPADFNCPGSPQFFNLKWYIRPYSLYNNTCHNYFIPCEK